MALRDRSILLVSGFLESELSSLREVQYARALAEAGADLTVFCSTQSHIWIHNRAKIKPTNPSSNDEILARRYGYRIVRRNPILRISDLMLILPPLRLIWQADVVHVIEFRQGFTVLVALFAKLMGKTVIYEHEQRGDRDYSALHIVDSKVRRVLIFVGSLFVDRVRFAANACENFFNACTTRRPTSDLTPLGANEDLFYFKEGLRERTRSDMDFKQSDRIAVMSGKLTSEKRVQDVAEACRRCGWKLVLVGRFSESLSKQLSSRNYTSITHSEWQPASALNAFYNMADAVIFTTCTVSYFEAAITGARVIVPRSAFSESHLSHESTFTLFGERSMFSVEDERYHEDYDLVSAIVDVLERCEPIEKGTRRTEKKYSWENRRLSLVEYYKSL